MEESLSRTHTIVINKKLYKFTSTDGEEHVEKLKSRVDQAFQTLSSVDTGQMLSNFAIKLILLLADEVVQEETARINQDSQINYRLTKLMEELDKALYNKN